MAHVLPTGSCSAITRTSLSGWYVHTNRFGCVIASKLRTGTRRPSIRGWTVPSIFYGGQTQYTVRKSWLAVQSHLWRTGALTNKANFLANAGSYTITTFDRGAIVPTPWQAWMWQTSALFAEAALRESIFTGKINWAPDPDCSPNTGRVLPPTINSASIDTTGKITINFTGSPGFTFYTTYLSPPVTSTAALPLLIVVDNVFTSAGAGVTRIVPASQVRRIMRPLPTSASVLIGVRQVDFDCLLTSDLAAVLVDVSP